VRRAAVGDTSCLVSHVKNVVSLSGEVLLTPLHDPAVSVRPSHMRASDSSQPRAASLCLRRTCAMPHGHGLTCTLVRYASSERELSFGSPCYTHRDLSDAGSRSRAAVPSAVKITHALPSSMSPHRRSTLCSLPLRVLHTLVLVPTRPPLATEILLLLRPRLRLPRHLQPLRRLDCGQAIDVT